MTTIKVFGYVFMIVCIAWRMYDQLFHIEPNIVVVIGSMIGTLIGCYLLLRLAWREL